MSGVRTRFAPSPTGFLHIGGLRTALFAFLFARRNSGVFILRIEDTDRNRFVDGALEDILESLKWTGIGWDEGPDVGGPHAPYLQSARRDIYRDHAFRLLGAGHAYKCFCSQERLVIVREEQLKQGKGPGYDRHCRYLPEAEVRRQEQSGRPFVIRLKVPENGTTVFQDRIRGTIQTQNATLEDTVLLKSDGYPTYHLANVVDDHLMEITHVIRGDEWISSTPRHVILYEAFGWVAPVFAHVPVILAQGGGKLSKRHGATTVREFRQRGYLSEAVLNYIALLGWSLDDRTELFRMDELIGYFDLERVNKAPAVFSYEKLDWLNGVYIRSKSTEELFDLILPFLLRDRLLTEEELPRLRDYILRFIPLIRERMSVLSEVSERSFFFFDRAFGIRDKAALIPKKLTRDQAAQVLERTAALVESLDVIEEGALEEAFRALVGELEMKPGPVFMTVRVAVTGTSVSPGLFETMAVLGRERVLNRLRGALSTLQSIS
jgi:glutamyl-tRNA synthetase